MPAGLNIWRKVAERFNDKLMQPKIWLGDPVHDDFAKEKYKDCLVLDFNEVHKVINFERSDFKLTPSFLDDKYFYMLKDQVYKMMDRQDDFGVFGRLEREAFFYSLFYYFHTIVREKKIDLLVSSEGPHSPAGMILYGVCKILDINTYHLAQGLIAPVAHICKDFHGEILEANSGYNFSKHQQLVSDYIGLISDDIPRPHYMEIQRRYDKKSKGINFRIKKYLIKPVKNYVFRREKVYGYNIYRRSFFNDNHRPLLYENFVDSRKKVLLSEYESVLGFLELDEAFVFVPLQYEPERTSNPDGGSFYNVYDMIMWLRDFLPNSIKIIIKEHPSQFSEKMHGYRGRSPLFYRAIMSLNNVFFVDMKVPSSELINKSIFVATQTGTAALEAALMGRKSLVFGAPWFLGVPNIYIYEKIESFDSFMDYEIFDKKHIKDFFDYYISTYALPVCINPSGQSYFVKKHGELFFDLIDDEFFSEIFTEIIYKDYVGAKHV